MLHPVHTMVAPAALMVLRTAAAAWAPVARMEPAQPMAQEPRPVARTALVTPGPAAAAVPAMRLAAPKSTALLRVGPPPDPARIRFAVLLQSHH
jgi:hypothetical protein